MTTFYLIRHAEAEGNLYRRPQGQYDSNITMLGRRQVAALAERFRDTPIDALWTSDLVRARSTASAILKYHPDLTMHADPALREVDVGSWEDRTWAELAREDPEQHRLFSQDPARWRVPGSESFAAVQARMKNALLGLAAAYPGKTVAVVSHAFVIRALASLLMGKAFAEIPYGDNTAVTTLTAQGGALALVSYADASHLGELRGRAPLISTDGVRRDGQFVPLALPAERELYVRCYSETWLASHGSLAGFAPSVYLHTAARHAAADPRCLMKLLCGGEMAGLIELDPYRGGEIGAGWVSLVWVEPDHRGRRFGAQLIGHAVSLFRREGREKLRLHAAQTNDAALAFYEAMGFARIGVSEGVGGPLYLMEMDIVPRVWCLP